VTVGLGFVVAPPFTRTATVQQRALGRPIRLMGFSALAVSLVGIVVLSVLGHMELFGVIGVLLLLYPLSYIYTIGHYRLFDLDLRVRRNVQYSVLSWLWGGAVAMALIWIFLAVPALHMSLPNVVLNGFSIEVRQEASTSEQQLAAQRLVAMLLGVGIWFFLWKMRMVGQRLLDRKYYRTQFDYRRAGQEVAEVLSTKLSMTDLATSLVHALMDLLKLRGAGLVVFRDGRTCCCDAATGVSEEAWRAFSCSLDTRFTDAFSTVQEALRVEQLPADISSSLSSMRFEYVIPIRSKGHLAGAILVGGKLSETPHSTEDLSFLSGVAKQVNVSIENAFLYEGLAEQDRMRHELSIARQIQLSSLPSTTPNIAGLDISGTSTPALEVGGDFFDYLDGTDKEIMVIVGDVSGKGTSAALYMSKVQGILRSLHQFSLAPQDLFQRANRLLCADMQKSSFITASAALFLPQSRQVKIVRAGHLPLYHYRVSDARIERIVPRGLGLGLSNAGIFATELEECVQSYAPGDAFVLVTDGVTEARDPSGQEYGEDRLSALIVKTAMLPAREMRDQILADLTAFGAGTEPHDDQTIVVVRTS
jgi:sigma-B regulation protein RsbU (phosphoserine phosphatase)